MSRRETPLLELFSTDLAVAKNDYETAVSQHDRDKQMLDNKTPLAKTDSIPAQGDDRGPERRGKKQAPDEATKDKLLVFGLTEKEIAEVPKEDGVKKAKMILRSPPRESSSNVRSSGATTMTRQTS